MHIKRLKISEMIIMLLIIIYPFLPLIKERSGGIGNILEIALIFILFIGIITQKRGLHTVLIDKNIIIIVCFLLFFLIEGIANEQSAFSGFRTFLFYVFLVFFLLSIEKKQLYNITSASIIAGIIMAVGALVQFVYPDFISSIHSADLWMDLRSKTDFTAFSIYNRSISFMTDPNILSVYLTFILLIGNIFLIEGNKKKVFHLIMIVSIVTTQSRTGIILVVMYYILLLVQNMLTKRTVKPVTLIIFSLVFVIGLSYVALKWNSIISFLRIDTFLNGNGRAENNITNLDYIFSKNIWNVLFGIGLGNGQSYIFENSYYLLMYMFGVLGCVMFLFFIYKIIKPICTRKNIILVIIYLVACLVGDYILIPHVTYVFLIGLVMSKVKYSNGLKGD